MQKNNRWILGILTLVILLFCIVFLAIFLTVSLKPDSKPLNSVSQQKTPNSEYAFKPLFLINEPTTINQNTTNGSNSQPLNATCDLSMPDLPLKNPRIIGGNEASPHSYPYIVSLRILRKKILYDHICSGILITTRTVLTAAHCVNALSTESTLIAVTGLHIRTDVSEYAFRNSIPVNKITVHSEFNPVTLENDIALLTLARCVIISSNVSLACILPEDETSNGIDGTIARVAGWGSNSIGSDKLQQTNLTLLENKDLKCERYLEGHVDASRIYCALHFESSQMSNVCLGDR